MSFASSRQKVVQVQLLFVKCTVYIPYGLCISVFRIALFYIKILNTDDLLINFSKEAIMRPIYLSTCLLNFNICDESTVSVPATKCSACSFEDVTNS